MKYIKPLIILILLPLALLILFTGCSSGGGSDNRPDERHVVSLQVTGDNQLAASFSTKLEVTAIFSDKTSENVTSAATWGQSTDSGIIRVLPEGIIEGLTPGAATVSVSYEDIKGITSATFPMTITDATVTALFIAPTNTPLGSAYKIPNGQFMSVTGLANFSDGRQLVDVTRDLSWTVDKSNILSIEKGVSRVKLQGKSIGTTTLTVDVADPSQSAQKNVAKQQTLTVTDAVLTKLFIDPSVLTLPKGIEKQLIVFGEYSDGTVFSDIEDVTWAIENTQSAQITQDGLLTTLAQGQTTIFVNKNLLQGEAQLVVNDASVVSIVVSPAEASIVESSKIAYSVTAIFSDGTEADFTDKVDWYSSNPAIAEVYNVNIIKGLQEGRAEISAILKTTNDNAEKVALQSNQPGILDVFKARVTAIKVETIDGDTGLPMIVSKAESLLPLNQFQSVSTGAGFKAQATFEDGNTQDITLADNTQWSIIDDQGNLNNTIAFVNAGRVIGLSSGKGAVRAESENIRGSSNIVTTGCPSLRVPNPRTNGSGVMHFSCPLRDIEATNAQVSFTGTSRGDGIKGPEFNFITHTSKELAAEYCANLNLDGHDNWELARYVDLLRLLYVYDASNDDNYLLFTEHDWPVQTNYWIADSDGGISLADATSEIVPVEGPLLTTCVRIQAP